MISTHLIGRYFLRKLMRAAYKLKNAFMIR